MVVVENTLGTLVVVADVVRGTGLAIARESQDGIGNTRIVQVGCNRLVVLHTVLGARRKLGGTALQLKQLAGYHRINHTEFVALSPTAHREAETAKAHRG